MNVNRRQFGLLSAAAATACKTTDLQSQSGRRLAVSTASYMIRQRLSRKASTPSNVPVFRDPIHFLEHCRGLGAGGLQVGVRGWENANLAKRLREKAEAHDMILEGQVRLPKSDQATEEFSRSILAAKEAGVKILRCVMLSGRRYETFPNVAKWKQFTKDSWTWLTRAEPIARKHRVMLALENHKDWRIDEMTDILRRLSSEHVGVNLDTGNNISLLEHPMKVAEALAPYTVTVHLKDMGVQEYQDGFLLSEVPLGEGFLDIQRIIRICEKARSGVQFNLEMITRDPLKIPCLTRKYWQTFADLRGSVLAEFLSMVRKNQSTRLPRIAGMSPAEQIAFEEANNRKCFDWFSRNA